MEKWKDIERFSGKYSISNTGKVKNNKSGRILKGKITRKGYGIVAVTINKFKSVINLHREVLIAFKPIDNPENYQGHHIDWNKLNNNISNLEWVSNKVNSNSKMFHSKSYKEFKRLLIELGDNKLTSILVNI